MKKTVTVFITLFILSLTVGISGCGNGIEPYFKMNAGQGERKRIAAFIPEFTEPKPGFTDSYGEFIDYFDEHYAKEGLSAYLLDPKFGISFVGPYCRQERDFYIYSELNGDKNQRYLFQESITVYDPDYFKEPDTDMVGGYYWTVSMEYFTAPVTEQVSGNHYLLEFGESRKPYDPNTERFYKYINIYVGDICVGTCYYRENNHPVTAEWFENYFRENLTKR